MSLCVLTKSIPTTQDRDLAEAKVHSAVVSLSALHASASVAQKGDYNDARIHLISVQRMLQRGMKKKIDQENYVEYIKQSERLDGFMRESQQQEQVFAQKEKSQSSRAITRDDTAARNIVQMKRVTINGFKR
eukprot:TRINITY_DN3792_c0_g2_i1.p1 TRINITY_DN3792_c0_g2~~TRINITY_DN3792_c0_g2_i1.p1  ORF type:complete len:143 (+),score=21.68 TRINITY_DN3792_c0_g2_i1:36-431(+)